MRIVRSICLTNIVGALSIFLSDNLQSATGSHVFMNLSPLRTEEKEKRLCENAADCGGILFRSLQSTRQFAKLLYVPVADEYSEVFISSKAWLVHRGLVVNDDANKDYGVIHTATNITIPDARNYCSSHPDCVAFSIPIQTEKLLGLTHDVDEAVFFNGISSFDYGIKIEIPDAAPGEKPLRPDNIIETEWATHILHDRTKLTGRVNVRVDIDDSKYDDFSTTPYRPCCHPPTDLPTIQEVRVMDTLKRISCNISREEFYNTYEKSRIPIMLTGCDDDWPAHKLWKDTRSLFDRFDNSSTWHISGVSENTTWSNFLEFYEQNVTHYGAGYRVFTKLEDGYLSTEVHKDYKVPQPFVDADIYVKLPQYEKRHFPIGFGPMHWFLIGSKGTGTLPHIDPHQTDAWNTLVYGHKWWIIYPLRPEILTEGETLCFSLCSTYNPPEDSYLNNGEEKSWYMSVGLHAHKMYFDQEAPMHILQRAGETIYLPYGYVHAVLNMDETIAVTQNYASPANLNGVWSEVLSQGNDRWKRLYFQHFNRIQRREARKAKWPIAA